MAEPRLATHVWVSAYLARLRSDAIACYIVAKGDETAGTVLVKCATMDGQASCFQRSFDLMTGARAWVVLAEGAEADVDASISRQRATDPDIWVIEVEDRQGRHLLDQEGLA